MELLVKYDNDQAWRLKYAKPGDVGLDLTIKISGSKVDPDLPHNIKPKGSEEDKVPWLEIPSNGFAEIETGIRVKLPDMTWGLITGRSSTVWKHRLICQFGIIDNDYTGPLKVLIYNPNSIPKRVHEGDRLAQLIIISRIEINKFVVVDELPNTVRGQSGFGSTSH